MIDFLRGRVYFLHKAAKRIQGHPPHHTNPPPHPARRVAMKMTQPSQVLLTSAKESKTQIEGKSGDGVSERCLPRPANRSTQQFFFNFCLAAQQTDATSQTANPKPPPLTPIHNQNTSLAAEKAALEKELAKLKAEKASLSGEKPRGPFGLPFAFGGGGEK
jgi:hypothetical protein